MSGENWRVLSAPGRFTELEGWGCYWTRLSVAGMGDEMGDAMEKDTGPD